MSAPSSAIVLSGEGLDKAQKAADDKVSAALDRRGRRPRQRRQGLQAWQTVKDYGNFELYVDWKIEPKGDSGIYLRGKPQVQIWDSDG